MADLVARDVFDRLPEAYRRRAREIAQRVGEIDALLAPCDVTAIRDSVIRLRGQFRPQPDTEPTTLADEYRAACRDLPEWALSEATNDYLGGRVENHTGQFMPTCAEFAKRAREIMTPFLAERAALRIEASKLVERAEDDARRAAVALERQDPAVRQRVRQMLKDAHLVAAPRIVRREQAPLSAEKRAAMDACRKPRPIVSRIAETRIVRGK